jgi:hypothetical protein
VRRFTFHTLTDQRVVIGWSLDVISAWLAAAAEMPAAFLLDHFRCVGPRWMKSRDPQSRTDDETLARATDMLSKHWVARFSAPIVWFSPPEPQPH